MKRDLNTATATAGINQNTIFSATGGDDEMFSETPQNSCQLLVERKPKMNNKNVAFLYAFIDIGITVV